MPNFLKKPSVPIAAACVGVFGSAFAFFRYLLPLELPDRPFSTVLLDRNGNEIAELLSSEKTRHRPLPPENVPAFMRSSLLALEDRRFFSHPGIDPVGIVRALVRNVAAWRVTEGASTVEMGLARAALGISDERTYLRKIREMAVALRIAGKYRKEETLAEYLNRIEFGRLSVGVAAASRTYFGKELANLTEAEQIALLAMAKNPAGLDPVKNPAAFRKRFETAVSALEASGVLTNERAGLVRAEKLSYPAPKDALPYVSDAVKRKDSEWGTVLRSGSPSITTTIDSNLTKHVKKIADGALSELLWRDVSDYAVLLVDRKTLEIRVFIGGADYASEEGGQVNALLSARQVGSTLKPFAYLLAMERLGMKTEDTVLDLPVSFQTADGMPYEPKDYSLAFRGAVTVAEALAGSLNVPAVRTVEKLGVREFLSFLRSLGITTLTKEPEHYGLSIALGTGEIPLYELLRAYTVFARGGEFCQFEMIPGDDVCRPAADGEKVAEIVRILTNRSFKLREFWVGTALDFPNRTVFVKTGTSRNFRDNYAVGFTEDFLLAVWSGNKDGTNMKGVSGATGAGEIFGRVVRELVPEDGGPKEEKLVPKKIGYFEILSPLPESRYRFDPSVPTERQSLSPDFSTDLEYDRATWTLDGKPFAGDIEIGKMEKGRHVLECSLSGRGTEAKASSVFWTE